MNPTWLRSDQASLFLAPMEGIVDAPMRELLTRHLPFTHVVTEFFRISSTVPPTHSYLEHSPELKTTSRTSSGTPVIFQLLGGDPGLLADAAAKACSLGAIGIDLNFGCPAPTVNRHDGGASLLRHPHRIKQIVSAVRAAVPSHCSVSAKVRLGWENIDDIDRNADAAFEGGADWLTIHARTRVQAYAPPVFWHKIAPVVKRAPVPVVANGDIWELTDVEKCVEITGTQHLMIGRGTLVRPNLIFDAARILGLKPKDSWTQSGDFESKVESWRSLLLEFAEVRAGHGFSSQHTLNKLKQWLSYRFKRKPFVGYERWKRSASLEEILSHLTDENLFSPLPSPDKIMVLSNWEPKPNVQPPAL